MTTVALGTPAFAVILSAAKDLAPAHQSQILRGVYPEQSEGLRMTAKDEEHELRELLDHQRASPLA